MPVVHHPLGLDLLDDQLLVGKRVDGESGDADRVVWLLPVASFGEREVEPLGIALGQVGLECRVIPIRLKGRVELAHERRRGHLGDADVPLDAFEQRAAGEVRGADVAGVEPGVTPEQPCLRVESRPLDLVVHLHLGAEVVDQAVEGATVGAAGVGRADDTGSTDCC